MPRISHALPSSLGVLQAVALILGCLLVGEAASGPEFSADMIADESHGKLYVGKSRMRLEISDPGSRSVAAVLLADSESGHVFTLMPEQHMYIDDGVAVGASPFGPFTRPADLARPCAEMARIGRDQKGDVLSCKSLGPDPVNNRPAQKWEGRYDGESGYLWVDPVVRFIVKLEGRGAHWELRNIKEGPQPPALFEVPSTYQKFDLGAKPKP